MVHLRSKLFIQFRWIRGKKFGNGSGKIMRLLWIRILRTGVRTGGILDMPAAMSRTCGAGA